MSDKLETILKKSHKDLKRAIDDIEKRKKDFLEILLIARNKEGWTYQEIADVLGISTSRVQQLVRQAQGKKRSNR